jgi:hypothetical protein
MGSGKPGYKNDTFEIFAGPQGRKRLRAFSLRFEDTSLNLNLDGIKVSLKL